MFYIWTIKFEGANYTIKIYTVSLLIVFSKQFLLLTGIRLD